MVKFKENVTGFVYNTINGDIMEIFTEPIPDNIRVYGEDILLFDDIESINDLFEFESKEDLESDKEGFNTILEWVE
jgi:hypothetical protein